MVRKYQFRGRRCKELVIAWKERGNLHHHRDPGHLIKYRQYHFVLQIGDDLQKPASIHSQFDGLRSPHGIFIPSESFGLPAIRVPSRLEQTSSVVRTMLLLSLLHTAGLSIDRFISVKLPNVYNIRVTSRISTLVCLCIWTVMITYHILLIFLSTNAPNRLL